MACFANPKEVLVNVLSRWQLSLRRKSKDFLFDGDDRVFKSILPSINCYAEYGVGKSSLWVLENSKASVLAVDTSEFWIYKVKSSAGVQANRFEIEWIDLGPIGWAGRPVSYAHRGAFQRYIQSPWTRKQKPQAILVDGRFRVASFLYSLAMADPGTIIFFDDYRERGQYHLVEEYLAPREYCGRQAIFEVPNAIDRSAVHLEAERFQYVMD